MKQLQSFDKIADKSMSRADRAKAKTRAAEIVARMPLLKTSQLDRAKMNRTRAS
jgi:hypothetical protein